MDTRLLRTGAAELPAGGLVDVHVHVAADDGPGLRLAEFSGLAEAAGVRCAALFPPRRAGGYAEANEALRLAVAGDAGRFRPFARLGGVLAASRAALWPPSLHQARSLARSRRQRPPADLLLDGAPLGAGASTPEFVAALRGFDGVNLLPHVDGFPSAAALTAISELGLPMVVHGGERMPPSLLERRLIGEVSGPIVLAHLGAYPASAPDFAAALELARRHEHVYLSTSGSWLAEFVAVAARSVPTKVLFGSCVPLMHPLVAWHQVAAAVRDDETLALIGSGNAERVLRW